MLELLDESRWLSQFIMLMHLLFHLFHFIAFRFIVIAYR